MIESGVQRIKSGDNILKVYPRQVFLGIERMSLFRINECYVGLSVFSMRAF